MDLSRAKAAHWIEGARPEDSHFLVDHEGQGFLPAYPADISPEERIRLSELSGGQGAESFQSVPPVEAPIEPGPTSEEPAQSFQPAASPERAAYDQYAADLAQRSPGVRPISFEGFAQQQYDQEQRDLAGMGEAARIAHEQRAAEARALPAVESTPVEPPLGTETLPPGSFTGTKPPPAAPGTSPGGGGGLNLSKELNAIDARQKVAMDAEAKAQSALDTAQAKHLQAQTEQLENISKDYNDRLARNAARQLALQSDNVNPRRLLEEMGPWGNLFAAIGLGVGTFGSALSNSPNTTLALFNSAIDRDIRAQEKNQDKNLRLNEEERIALHQEREDRKADALDLATSIMKQEAAKQAPDLNRAHAEVLKATLDRASLGMRNSLADSAMARQIQGVQIGNVRFQQKIAEDAQRVRQEVLEKLRGGGYSPAAANVTQHIIGDPDRELQHLVQYPGAMLTDKNGLPRVDKAGRAMRGSPTDHLLLDPKQRTESDKVITAELELGDSLAQLTALTKAHPEGNPFALEDQRRASQLQSRMATQIAKLEGLGALSGPDLELAKQQLAGLDIVGGVTGGTRVALQGLAQHLGSIRNSNLRTRFILPQQGQ